MTKKQTTKKRGHSLMPKAIRDKLPKLYEQEEVDDPICYVKFFTPDSNWYWYITEFDGEDIMFGMVDGHFLEMGYVSLSELEEVNGPLNLPIERDLHWGPKPLSEVKAEINKRNGTDG